MEKKRARVPKVLWRLFRNRASTLRETILSLVPPANCKCKGRRCLGCIGDYDAMSAFLLRKNDSADYRKLLKKCFVVVSDTAPPILDYDHHCRWPQKELVRRTIEMMMTTSTSSKRIEMTTSSPNVICSSYDKMSRFSDTVKLLTSPAWGLLLKRIGDALMFYLLKNTSIFLRLSKSKYRQVAGVPVSDLCPKSRSGTTYNSSYPKYGKKRKSVDEAVSSTRKETCIRKNCGMEKFAIGTTTSGEATSACSEELPSRKGQHFSNTHTSLGGKRKRQYKWQRQSKRMQLNTQGTHSIVPCMSFNTKSKCSGDQKCDVNSNSRPLLEKANALCSCCLVFQTLPEVKKEVQINRQTILYKLESCSSVFPSKQYSDILNSLRPNSSGANRLFKVIFGSLAVNVPSQIAPCMHSRNCNLSGSTCLFHSIIKLLKALIWKAHHCQHLRLLEKHCSVPSLDQGTKSIAATIVEANESEASILAKDCAESGLAHNVFKPESCNTTPQSQSSLLVPTKYYCPKKHVVSFIWAVCRSIVPKNLLGTPYNWRFLTKNISKLVRLRRFEKFTLKQCLRRVKLSRYPILSDEYSFLLKHKVLDHWIFWFFSSFIVPLVQGNFYVTEAQHEKQDILYYRKPTWENIISKALTCLRDQGYQELNAASVRKIIRNRSFGFSKARLLPKEKGVRMLANLKASQKLPGNHSVKSRGLRKVGVGRNVKCEYYKSVNEVLKDFHLVLKHIVAKEPKRLGSSVFDYNDVYKRLFPFQSLLKSGSPVKPGVFIIVSDVEGAFDSVVHDKLLSVLDDLSLEDEYSFGKVVQVLSTKKSLWIQQNWTLRGKENVPGSDNVCFCLPAPSLHGILVKQQVQGRTVRKEQLQNDLKEHIKRNVLQLGNRFFLQSVGIPQGSVLSSLLCSLYYGHLEKSVIFPFLKKACKPAHEFPSEECSLDDTEGCGHVIMCKPNYLLVRYIDDLLFISTSREQASRFFSRLQRGFRAYNCDMNEQKFGMNFQMNILPGSSPDRLYVVEDGTSFLRWSGLFINCLTLEIQADYTRYLNTPLSSALTVSWLKKPGRELKAKLRDYLRSKCHPIFYDSNINSAVVVRLNIYQAFLLCAMKFHCYISELSNLCRFNTKLYADALRKSLRYMERLIKKRMFSFKSGLDFRPILEVGKEEIKWLGLTAYIRVLKRKESRYKYLLHSLRSKLMELGNLESTSVLQQATDDMRSSILWRIKY